MTEFPIPKSELFLFRRLLDWMTELRLECALARRFPHVEAVCGTAAVLGPAIVAMALGCRICGPGGGLLRRHPACAMELVHAHAKVGVPFHLRRRHPSAWTPRRGGRDSGIRGRCRASNSAALLACRIAWRTSSPCLVIGGERWESIGKHADRAGVSGAPFLLSGFLKAVCFLRRQSRVETLR